MKISSGDRIRILKINYCIPDSENIDTQAKLLEGKEGVVTYIDDIGQIHGTWGGLALIPEIDIFDIINQKQD